MRRYLVFGDIHGRLALMLTIAALWERSRGQRLDGLLQVGDMGAFPNHARLDDATARHARRDPDELGYRAFLHAEDEAAPFLRACRAPIYFVRGNHEDFEHLAAFPRPQAVDAAGRIIYIPDGQSLALGDGLLLGAFGGIPPSTEARGRGRSARDRFRKAGRRAQLGPERFTEEQMRRAFKRRAAPDILMTHAGPACSAFPRGSSLLAELAERVRPGVHLFGHHHAVVGPERGPGGALLVGLEHLCFDRGGALKAGSWGALEMAPGGVAAFRFPTDQDFAWLPRLRRESYRSLTPRF